MPAVRVGDVDLHYELIDCSEPWHAGPPPVVLLHGLGGDRRTWLYQVPELCGRVPVLLVDLRGHGRSSAPPGEWSVADMARDVVRLLRQLGCEKASLVGFSLGGMVAQQFALDYPYATAALVLADTIAGPPPGADPRPLGDALAFIEAQPMRAIAETRITAAFTDAVDPVMRGYFIEQVALCDHDAYVRAARAAYSFDVRERLAEIDAPTLVLIGEGDRTLPMAWMEDVAAGIRDARLVRIAGAAHGPHLEQPRAFNAALRDFLRL